MSKIWGIGDPRFDPRLMDRPEPDEALSPACCEAGVEEERNDEGDIVKAICAGCGAVLWRPPLTDERIQESVEAYKKAMQTPQEADDA